MKVSLSLTALALCLASAAADPIAKVTVEQGSGPKAYDAQEDECTYIDDRISPVKHISIASLGPERVQCVFFTDDECNGHEMILNMGEHSFSRYFYVSTFQCYQVEE